MIATIQQDDLRRAEAAGTTFLRRPGSRKAMPLVLLHGIGGDARSWTSTISAIDPQFETLAWDAPGYGGSDPLRISSPTPADYASALARLLDALGMRQVVLVGHSLGALFAASFAASRPERIAGLALLSPALGYRVPAGFPLPPKVQARIEGLARLGPAAYAAKSAPGLVYRPETKPAIVARIETVMAAVRAPGYAQAVRALGAGDLLSDIAAITAPVLVAVGEQDVVTPPANARLLHDAIQNPYGFLEIANAGHALPHEAPDAVAAALIRLIKRVTHA